MGGDGKTWKSGAAQAAEAIGTAIVRGDFAESSRLPLEAVLAENLNVSRNTLREAIKLLAAKSLVEVAPRRGTIVLSREHWNVLDEDVLKWCGPILQADPDFMDELIRIRRLVEPAAAYDAAKIATPNQISQIRNAYREMATIVDQDLPKQKVEADIAFHLAVSEAANNRFILSITRSIIHAVRANFHALNKNPKHLKGNLENHRLVSEAIAQKDPEAAKTSMERLIERNRNDTKNLIGIK